MEGRFLNLLYFLAIDEETKEPRRGFFFVLYYVIGFFVTFLVMTMVLLCLEVYDFPWVREVLYHQLGENVLLTLESLLF